MDVFVPWSGRRDVLSRLVRTLKAIEHPGGVRYVVLNGSDGDGADLWLPLAETGREMVWSNGKPPIGRANAASYTCTNVDGRLRDAAVVAGRMAWIMSEARRLCSGDLVLVIEEDVEPPNGFLEKLLAASVGEDSIGVVAAAVPSRWRQDAPLVWRWTVEGELRYVSQWGKGVEDVGGTGFGCTLVRPRAWDAMAFRPFYDESGRHPGHDIAVSYDLWRQKVRWRVCWEVRCEHHEYREDDHVDGTEA